MKTLIKILFLNIFSILIANNSYLDKINERHGFVIGFGGGLHNGTCEGKQGISSSMSFNYSGISTDYKIGYAPFNNCELYFSSKASYFKNNNTNLITTLNGFGLTIFLNIWDPSLYVGFIFGKSDYRRRDKTFSYDSGEGYSYNIGYEYSPNIRLQLNFVTGYELISNFFNPAVRLKTSEINLTVNYNIHLKKLIK